MDSQGSRKEKRDYWFGEDYIEQGWAQATELIERKPTGNAQVHDAVMICLGREEEILPILQGKAKIPDDIHPKRRAVLESILEREGVSYGDTVSERSSIQRGRHVRAVGHKEKHARHAPPRKRLPISQVVDG